MFANEAERDAVPGLDAGWVIKLGARGAIFPEGHYGRAAVAALDTTGAGDALAAGYLVGGPGWRWPPRPAASRAPVRYRLWPDPTLQTPFDETSKEA